MDKPIITRNVARAEGFDRFFTGKPCKHGHIAERYVSNYVCVKCTAMRDQSKQEIKKPKAQDPELNYAQIGKAIVTHIKRVEKLAESTVDVQSTNEKLMRDIRILQDKLTRKNKTIETLNLKLQQMNEARQSQPSGNFKLSEIARFK